jgi:hypothetical protein
MSSNKGRKATSRRNSTRPDQQKKMARSLDALAEFDKFNESILPQLQKMLLENWSPERIRRMY